MYHFLNAWRKRCLTVMLCFATALFVPAQIPQDIPHQTEPVDFSSTRNIVIYIGLPILFVVAYILLRKWARKQREQGKR